MKYKIFFIIFLCFHSLSLFNYISPINAEEVLQNDVNSFCMRWSLNTSKKLQDQFRENLSSYTLDEPNTFVPLTKENLLGDFFEVFCQQETSAHDPELMKLYLTQMHTDLLFDYYLFVLQEVEKLLVGNDYRQGFCNGFTWEKSLIQEHLKLIKTALQHEKQDEAKVLYSINKFLFFEKKIHKAMKDWIDNNSMEVLPLKKQKLQ